MVAETWNDAQLNTDPGIRARFRHEIAAHGAVKDQVHVVRAPETKGF